MKIGIISDTHGSYKAIDKAVSVLGDVKLWLHAGDYSQDGRYLCEISGLKVVAVKGNCDGEVAAKPDEFVDIAGKKIWLTHGHRYGVKRGIGELVWWGRVYEADIIVYGHTHNAGIERDGSMLIINPGSASLPRDGRPSCGIVEFLSNGEVDVRIVDLQNDTQ